MIGVRIDEAAIAPEPNLVERIGVEVGKLDVDPAELPGSKHRLRIIEMLKHVAKDQHVERPIEVLPQVRNRELDGREALPGDRDPCLVIVDAKSSAGGDAADHVAGPAAKLEHGVGRRDPVEKEVVLLLPVQIQANRVLVRKPGGDPGRVQHQVELPGTAHRKPAVEAIREGQAPMAGLGTGQLHERARPLRPSLVKVVA